MGKNICQHITKDYEVSGQYGNLFFGQTFGNFTGYGREGNEIGTVFHNRPFIKFFILYVDKREKVNDKQQALREQKKQSIWKKGKRPNENGF